MVSSIRFHQKITLSHKFTSEEAIAELKIIQVPISQHYPDGLKYSLFLVLKHSGKILVGLDNHKPKGHHIHFDHKEESYEFLSMEILIDDFWNYVKEKGFLI